MSKLIKRIGWKETLDLSERLTLQSLSADASSIGENVGRHAADVLKACFKGISDLEIPEGPDA